MKLWKKASKGFAATIGFISEGMSARKPDPPDEDEDEQHSEDWYLDEIQDLLSRDGPEDPETKPESKIRSKDVDILAEAFLRNHHPPPAPRSGDSSSKDYTARTRLAYPVILPQRSFYSRKCGFIRAYAPVLANCGIDQTTFLDFLDMIERATHVKPWLFAINIASFGTAMLPNGIPMATPIAVKLNVKEAMKAEERRCVKRTNTYIDIVNDEFFRPRGLYCLVLTWRPETFSPYTTFDQPVGPDLPIHTDDEASILENFRSKYQRPDGTTYERRVPFLETAPLVFPQLDDLQDRGDPWPTLSGRIREEEFFANYLEKRAQAQSTTDNPDSAKGPRPTCSSRYADLAHPSNEGSLVSAVSGGKVDPDQVLPALSARRSRRYQKQRRSGPVERLVSRLQRGSSRSGTSSGPHNERHRSSPGPRQLGAQFGFVSGIKKFTSNTIYLMIVNMPTEEEMAQAEEMIR